MQLGDQGLRKNLYNFLQHIDSIRDTLPMTILLLKPYQEKVSKELKLFSKKVTTEIEIDGEKKFAVLSDEFLKYNTLVKNATISGLALKIIPESLFVSLISQYDSFLNQLLRLIFQIKPEILNGSQKNLTFSELIEFGSLEKARDFIIEKEIESVLRESHTSHFEYLENRLGISLRTNLPIWSMFIEITERRNLFVHCDGLPTNQYFTVCGKNNVPDLDKIIIGERLKVPVDYFYKAYECLYELSVKLTHTIWRKLLPDDLEDADSSLNSICYDLLGVKHFELADIILEFACGQKKFFNDSSKNTLLVNKALSKLLNKKEDEAKKIISSKDWSASGDIFKLAYNVIVDNEDEVYSLMKKIGNDGDLGKADYKQFPLFSNYRQRPKFKDLYKEIFEEDLLEIEIPASALQKILKKEIKKGTPAPRKTAKKAAVKKNTRTDPD